MYFARIRKTEQYVDPRDISNFGFLKAIPRIKLLVSINYSARLNHIRRNREFHIASISAEQIICDHLYQVKNGLRNADGLTDKMIIAGIDRHYSKGGINLEMKELVGLVYDKYLPVRDRIITQFKEGASEYEDLTKS